MKIPDGVTVPESVTEPVLKLNKAMYGLRQASRCWNEIFKDFLHSFNFNPCDSENSIFVRKLKNDVVYIILYVDDGMILAKDREIITTVLSSLKSLFVITVCEPETFVGVQI